MPYALSAEVRQYPTGTVIDGFVRRRLSALLELDYGVGADIAYHGHQGVQDREEGWGYGGTIGIRRFLGDDRRPYFVGLRADLWRMRIDWENHSNAALPQRGTSRFLIVQPTVEIGRDVALGASGWLLTPVLSAGYEANAFVSGAPTGQGIIALFGLALSR